MPTTIWAWYLGHHWGYRREAGEPQLTINFCKALSDFITNFTFGRGVTFRTPDETEGITPARLRRVWEVDNNKEALLWEIGQLGGVSGDVFVKVAYEEPWVDTIKRQHPGRVRLIPLNPAHCFPEFHPHDRSRMIRFKLKYRFWGTSLEGTRQVFTYCVDESTEILTQQGWKKHHELVPGELVLGLDPETEEIVWQPVEKVNVFDYRGDLVRWEGEKIDALSTWNHRWLYRGRGKDRSLQFKITAEFWNRSGSLVFAGGEPACFATEPIYSDDFVELLGWALGEGHYAKDGCLIVSQSKTKNPGNCERLQRLVQVFSSYGLCSVYGPRSNGVCQYRFARPICDLLKAVAPVGGLPGGAGQPSISLLSDLTLEQADSLFHAMYWGDGTKTGVQVFGQLDPVRTDFFVALATMLGYPTRQRWRDDIGINEVTIYRTGGETAVQSLRQTPFYYEGKVWCPSTATKTWLARRNGSVYWTGNTELITDTALEEYVNDEILDQRENPLGLIPIVQIVNQPVSGSPWGLSDLQDITTLNREYNEKATEISDIINYHAAPVTVITGAKASQLEKGPRKVWGGLPKEANVFNLELGGNLAGPIEYLAMLKTHMHEMTGVPESALGQIQPISNTSGVALAIQYQPMMQRYNLKKIQYGLGLTRINELIMLTLALKEPQMLQWDPSQDEELKPGQLSVLDPQDPLTYQTTVHWPPPLPIDELVELNAIQQKMALGLESKRGALRDLGHDFPDEKMQEVFQELIEDAKEQGALELLKAQIMAAIAQMTGVVPGADGEDPGAAGGVTSAGGPNVNPAGGGAASAAPVGGGNPLMGEQQQLMTEIVTQAFGTKMAQRRAPETDQGE